MYEAGIWLEYGAGWIWLEYGWIWLLLHLVLPSIGPWSFYFIFLLNVLLFGPSIDPLVFLFGPLVFLFGPSVPSIHLSFSLHLYIFLFGPSMVFLSLHLFLFLLNLLLFIDPFLFLFGPSIGSSVG